MTEPNRDRRKVWWAVLASVVLHVLIGLSLAAFGGSRQDVALEEPQVPQLTIEKYTLPNGLQLLGSYHPSLRNTNTGRLDRAMFTRIFVRARSLAGLD